MSDQGGEKIGHKENLFSKRYNELLAAYDAINASHALVSLEQLGEDITSGYKNRGFNEEEIGQKVSFKTEIGVSDFEKVKKIAKLKDRRLAEDMEGAGSAIPLGETFYRAQLTRSFDVRGIRGEVLQKGQRGIEVTAYPGGNLRIAEIMIVEGTNQDQIEYLGSRNIPKNAWQDNPSTTQNFIRDLFYGRASNI